MEAFKVVFLSFTFLAKRFAAAKDCAQLYHRGVRQNGVYHVTLGGSNVSVYCDMTTDGGGWTVFQRREDAAVDFYRNYSDYVNGFGSVGGNHWLGLEAMHQMSLQPQQLRVEMEGCSNDVAHGKYPNLTIGNSDSGYELNVGGYVEGDSGDSLKYHNGMKFSTFDKDQDPDARHCARVFKGGFWYVTCHAINPNGLYPSSSDCSVDIAAMGLSWYTWKGHYYSALKTKWMMRPMNFEECNKTESSVAVTDCSTKCNGGIKSRKWSKILPDKSPCAGPIHEYAACNTHLCLNYNNQNSKTVCDGLSGVYVFSNCYFVGETPVQWGASFDNCGVHHTGATLARIYDTSKAFDSVKAFILNEHPNEEVWLSLRKVTTGNTMMFNWVKNGNAEVAAAAILPIPKEGEGQCVWMKMANVSDKADPVELATDHCQSAGNRKPLCMIANRVGAFQKLSGESNWLLVNNTLTWQSDAVDVHQCITDCINMEGCVGFNLMPDVQCQLLAVHYFCSFVFMSHEEVNYNTPNKATNGVSVYTIETSRPKSETYARVH